MDGKPNLLNQFQQKTKHSYSFAISPSTGCFWPISACLHRQQWLLSTDHTY